MSQSGGAPQEQPDWDARLYDELRKLARRYMRRERPDHTLQPTALVNEAYLRLARNGQGDWRNRTHFFACAAKAMRRILVDHARARKAAKRPGHDQRVELNDFMATQGPTDDEVLDIDRQLGRLAQLHPRQARVVEMMFFGGMSQEEAAEVLGVSVRTVKRDWEDARTWIHSQLGGKDGLDS